MILYFPNLDALRLALTSGTVPPAVSLKAAVAGFDDQDHLWLQTDEALPRSALTALGRLGVQVKKASDAPLSIDVCCWLQALPLEAASPMEQPSAQAPVLFELTGAGQLADLVAEILRLGNDRQSFRWLENGGEVRGLLRVIGPPYYSLLRALDRSGRDAAPRAYLEHSPRVWVEVGHTHPLLGHIKPPKNQLLLLRPPRDWTVIDEAPFQDIYDILEFELPEARPPWNPVPLKDRLCVPLRLTRGGRGVEAELWVLREGAMEHLDAFVRGADDSLLARLAFAVGESGPEKCIVVRVRPSKEGPPVLVLPATTFRPFLKMPNLFLPCGTQLHPPLRRDAVRKLLADNLDWVTWLYPGPDGAFTAESMPEAAFRPLSDWVEYVLDHDHEALQTWVDAARFEFEPFVCKDDQATPPEKPPAKEQTRRPTREKAREEVQAGAAQDFRVVNKSRKKESAAQELAELPRVKPSELQQQLRAVEKEFLGLSGALDSPERLELWPKMAQLHKALRSENDATVCWVNALWEAEAEAPQLARAWARGECLGAGEDLKGAELDRLLGNDRAGLQELRGLASRLTLAAHQDRPPAALLQRLGTVQRFLGAHESLLPVRATWLAWASVVKLSRGDVLGLARARDRLLERLFTHGLSPDRDLPSFLRFSGIRASERYRAFRDWLMGLSGKVYRWIERNKGGAEKDDRNPVDTAAYADLILSFGLARLGESSEPRRLQQGALERLELWDNEVHNTLMEAFCYRINQALENKLVQGPLPPAMHEYLEHMDRMARYKVDRLRKNSRILEPHERIDPYRMWTAQFFNDLEKTLANLTDIRDRQALADQIRKLLDQSAKDQALWNKHLLVLIKALELAPRVGEEFTLEVLARVAPALEMLEVRGRPGEVPENEIRQRADFLEKALIAAAHFNHVEFVQPLIAQFETLLQSLRGSQNLHAVESLAGECFRGLRKLGMRDQIERLLRVLEDVILQGRTVESLGRGATWGGRLGPLLQVAGNWYYFGRDPLARPVMDLARRVLFQGELKATQLTDLACAYVHCLGQAPVELAQPGIEEVFARLEGVHDAFTTSTHFSASQLRVIEAVVLTVVTEEFAVGTTARHWLDDDEFLVRRRIHRDMQALMSQTHM
jgi:hypothetical protein